MDTTSEMRERRNKLNARIMIMPNLSPWSNMSQDSEKDQIRAKKFLV